jgi:hypothetical protein
MSNEELKYNDFDLIENDKGYIIYKANFVENYLHYFFTTTPTKEKIQKHVYELLKHLKTDKCIGYPLIYNNDYFLTYINKPLYECELKNNDITLSKIQCYENGFKKISYTTSLNNNNNEMIINEEYFNEIYDNKIVQTNYDINKSIRYEKFMKKYLKKHFPSVFYYF